MDGLRPGGRAGSPGRGAFTSRALFGFARNLVVVIALITAFAPRALFGADPYFDRPKVVVYGFQTSGDTLSNAGDAIATGLAQRMAVLGGLDVLPVTPGTKRPQYLTNAVSQNADYYITGFVTTIGANVSMIAQVVSTASGTVVWSNTYLVASLEDAISHANDLRTAVLLHAGRSLAAYDAHPAGNATARPAPEESGHVSTNILGVFGRRGRRPAATPSPAPAPAPTATPVSTPLPSIPSYSYPTANPAARGARTVAQATSRPRPTATPLAIPALETSPPAAPAASLAPEPTASPTPEPTASPTPEPTASPMPEPTQAPSPVPTASPAPKHSPGPRFTPYNIILATPTPRPTVTATAPALALLQIGGDAEPTAREYAAQALLKAFAHEGYAIHQVPIAWAQAHSLAPEACSASPGATGVVQASLHVDARLITELYVSFYDCVGEGSSVSKMRRSAVARSGFISVIDGLAKAVAADHHHRFPPPSRVSPAAGS